MIHNDIQNQLQHLVKIPTDALVDIADHPVETPQWTVGQRLPAHVLASLPNGRFQVQIENQILDMNLPRNTQPGATLELAYAGNSPRLTFVLVGNQSGNNAGATATKSNTGTMAAAKPADPSLFAADAAEQPLLTEATVIPPYIPDAPVKLSDTAKFLGGLQHMVMSEKVETPAQQPKTGVPVVRESSPLLTAPPDQAQELAQALSKSLSQSGLFYESHQLQWISGERPLAMLKQEPQAVLTAPPPQSAEPKPTEPEHPHMQLVLIDDPVVPETPAIPVETMKGPINSQTLPLVQQQLGVLDSRQVVWQGQVWPGQDMRWEVEEDANYRGADGEPSAGWKTRLSLKLPRLGGVTAHLALNPQGVRIEFDVANNSSADLIKRERLDLRKSFETAGLHLLAVSVKQHETGAQNDQP